MMIGIDNICVGDIITVRADSIYSADGATWDAVGKNHCLRQGSVILVCSISHQVNGTMRVYVLAHGKYDWIHEDFIKRHLGKL